MKLSGNSSILNNKQCRCVLNYFHEWQRCFSPKKYFLLFFYKIFSRNNTINEDIPFSAMPLRTLHRLRFQLSKFYIAKYTGLGKHSRFYFKSGSKYNHHDGQSFQYHSRKTIYLSNVVMKQFFSEMLVKREKKITQ